MRTIKCLYNNIPHDIEEEYFAYKLKHFTNYNYKIECDDPFGFIMLKLNIPFIPIKKDDIIMLLDKYFKNGKKHTFYIHNAEIYEELTTVDIEKLENIGIFIINERTKIINEINVYVKKLIFRYGILDTKSILKLINKNIIENGKYSCSCYSNVIREIIRNVKYINISIPVFE